MSNHERPNSFPLPPVLAIALLILAIAADRLVPVLALSFEPGPVGWAGWAIVLAALLLDFWAMREFRHHKTNIMPTNPALSLVDTGPFAFSRNPIYLGNVMLLAGFGLAFGIGVLFILALINGAILQVTQIRGEEAHLAARFGQAWDDYSARVRRWL